MHDCDAPRSAVIGEAPAMRPTRPQEVVPTTQADTGRHATGVTDTLMLLWHFAQVLHHALADIPWAAFTAAERRRVLATIRTMVCDLHRASDSGAKRPFEPSSTPPNDKSRPT